MTKKEKIVIGNKDIEYAIRILRISPEVRKLLRIKTEEEESSHKGMTYEQRLTKELEEKLAIPEEERDSEDWLHIGYALSEFGEKEKAKDAYEKLLKEKFKIAPARRNSEDWLYIGEALMNAGKEKEAEDAYLKEAEVLEKETNRIMEKLIWDIPQTEEDLKKAEKGEMLLGRNHKIADAIESHLLTIAYNYKHYGSNEKATRGAYKNLINFYTNYGEAEEMPTKLISAAEYAERLGDLKKVKELEKKVRSIMGDEYSHSREKLGFKYTKRSVKINKKL